eukprot:TRINITY_DN27239_c0_g1_i1.p1 TRINITY_DN27239_c0_g1~~TRINITY_DN27239_c0_g1_i1.p1  ORF type:complete len:311 (-),score=44.31 TRINITY_DN27239_c0_g1_i1:112-1044(-)
MMCCLLPCRGRVPPFEQAVVVMRHSDRLDQCEPGYLESAEGRAWPFDAPLTNRGIRRAREVGEELREAHAKTAFHYVASSPYRRCLQTAAEVASVLGIPVIIDQELGEVWEKQMPVTENYLPYRSKEDLEALATQLGIAVKNPHDASAGGLLLFGKAPDPRPETLEMGHKRLLARCEVYMNHSTNNRKNVIIVSHAAAVAAMQIIWGRGHVMVDDAKYCARVIGTRFLPSGRKEHEHGVFGDRWQVEARDLMFKNMPPAASVAQYHERLHLEYCDEISSLVAKRNLKRSDADDLFDDLFAEADDRADNRM